MKKEKQNFAHFLRIRFKIDIAKFVILADQMNSKAQCLNGLWKQKKHTKFDLQRHQDFPLRPRLLFTD